MMPPCKVSFLLTTSWARKTNWWPSAFWVEKPSRVRRRLGSSDEQNVLPVKIQRFQYLKLDYLSKKADKTFYPSTFFRYFNYSIIIWHNWFISKLDQNGPVHFDIPRNYGTQVAVRMARAVLARHLCLELERVHLISLGALLEDLSYTKVLQIWSWVKNVGNFWFDCFLVTFLSTFVLLTRFSVFAFVQWSDCHRRVFRSRPFDRKFPGRRFLCDGRQLSLSSQKRGFNLLRFSYIFTIKNHQKAIGFYFLWLHFGCLLLVAFCLVCGCCYGRLDRGVTVQVMPDPLEAQFAKALGLEHFVDAMKDQKRVSWEIQNLSHTEIFLNSFLVFSFWKIHMISDYGQSK